jgi:hypothetical protein
LNTRQHRRARGRRIAPQCEFSPPATAGLDRGDDRLRQLQPRRAHGREIAIEIDRPPLARGDRLEVRAAAECSTLAGEHRDVERSVAVERLECLIECARRRQIDRVAPLRAVDADDRDAPTALDDDRFHDFLPGRFLAPLERGFAFRTLDEGAAKQ